MRIAIIVITTLLSLSTPTFAQFSDGWPFAAPTATNVDIGDWAHLSAALNPLNSSELLAIALSPHGNGKYPYKSTVLPDAVWSHLNTYHSMDGGATWTHNVDSGEIAHNFIPSLTGGDGRYTGAGYETPAVGYRIKSGKAQAVAVFKASKDHLSGIYFTTASHTGQPTTNPINTDWAAATIIEEHYSTTTTIPYVFSPSIAVDNFSHGTNSHLGRTYILYNTLPVLSSGSCGPDTSVHYDYNHITLHLAYVDTNSSTNYVDIAGSTIDSPAISLNQRQLEAGSVAVGPDGTVFISFLQHEDYDWCGTPSYHHLDTTDAVTFNNSWRTNLCALHIAYSTNGGSTFKEISLGADSILHQVGLWDGRSSNTLALGFFHVNVSEHYSFASATRPTNVMEFT